MWVLPVDKMHGLPIGKESQHLPPVGYRPIAKCMEMRRVSLNTDEIHVQGLPSLIRSA